MRWVYDRCTAAKSLVVVVPRRQLLTKLVWHQYKAVWTAKGPVAGEDAAETHVVENAGSNIRIAGKRE
jgi:hypothetical protein